MLSVYCDLTCIPHTEGTTTSLSLMGNGDIQLLHLQKGMKEATLTM